jgi:NAD+ synthase (glutamine-hydrolysing)
MHPKLIILMAQINPLVGAISANADTIITVITEQQEHHDLIIFPELALTGYPPEDLLLRDDFYRQVEQTLTRIQSVTANCTVILGHPAQEKNCRYTKVNVLRFIINNTYPIREYLMKNGTLNLARLNPAY